MIFMSQSGLTDAGRAADWDTWYVEHLRTMVTVPGIFSAQRFVTESPQYPPSLAMYSVAGAEVFDDPYYRSVRGLGEWLPLVDRRHYQRNLFSGLDAAPPVASGTCLLMADRAEPDAALAGTGFTWLTCIGIDRSTAVRGIAVVDTPLALERVAVYRPVTEYMRSARPR